MSENTPKDWVDRDRALTVPFEAVLEAFELLDSSLHTRKGDNLQSWCPIGSMHGKRDSFGVNVVKNVFNCFACKKKGNVIDFVMAFQNVSFKDAARCLNELLDCTESRLQEAADTFNTTPLDEFREWEPIAAEQQPTPVECEHMPLTTREQYLIDCAVEKTLLTLATRIVVADKGSKHDRS